MSPSIQDLIRNDSKQLEAALVLEAGSARIEVQMLLQQVLGVSRAHLLAHPEQALDEAQAAAYRALLRRRLAGEPLAYLLGEREFFGLTFRVTPATLIPRPDTELLVELALGKIPSPPTPLPQVGEGGRQAGRGFRALDLGTGSGAIALSIAHARPDVEVTAVDASQEALEVARENARRLLSPNESTHTSTGSVRTDSCEATMIGNTRLLRSDWFSALRDERYDLIVSNPPYIADGDAHLAQGDLRFEPRGALASGADGLDDIRHIVANAKQHLNASGWLLFEHGYDQAARARELLGTAGYAEVFSARDLAGIERVSGGVITQ